MWLVSEPEPSPDEASGEETAPPAPPLTAEEQNLALNAQLILFTVAAVFIIAPFIIWWWLSTHQ
jgi:hypothetical protein